MKKFLGLCLFVAAFAVSGSARAEYMQNYSSPYSMQQPGYSHGSPQSMIQPYGGSYSQPYSQPYTQPYGMQQPGYSSSYQNQSYRQCRNPRTGYPQQCRRPRRRAGYPQQGCGMQGGCGGQGMGMGMDPYNSYAGYGGGYGGQGFGGGYSSGFSMSLSFGGGGGCNMF